MLPEMNKTFNINRFGRLFKKHSKEHYRNYLMSVGVLVGVMLLGGSFLVYMADVQLDKNLQTFFSLLSCYCLEPFLQAASLRI